MTTLQVKKNINLSGKFTDYLIKNPKKLDGIPKNANIIVIPRNDKELAEENKKLLQKSNSKYNFVAQQTKGGWQIKKFKQ